MSAFLCLEVAEPLLDFIYHSLLPTVSLPNPSRLGYCFPLGPVLRDSSFKYLVTSFVLREKSFPLFVLKLMLVTLPQSRRGIWKGP